MCQGGRDVNPLVNNAGVLFAVSGTDDKLRGSSKQFLRQAEYGAGFAPIIQAKRWRRHRQYATLVALASMPGLSIYNASKAAACR